MAVNTKFDGELINFAKSSLGTVVSCNQVALDGYEASNLLSNIIPTKGFIADSFVRPPVFLTFTLPCHVDLDHVQIKVSVGSQRSSGLEILTSSSCSNSALSLFSHGNDFYTVGTCRVDDNQCEDVIFLRKSTIAPSNNVQIARHVMRHRINDALSRVRILLVKIFRTQGSSVPALGRITIWGRISPTVNPPLATEIRYKWEQTLRPRTFADSPSSSTSHSSAQPTNASATAQSIPDTPIRLPSGNVIDRSTLDRYINDEANWGRSPSDPFTGVAFSAQLKPVLDSALKARIDQFLVFHQDEPNLKHVPRTTGGRSNNSHWTLPPPSPSTTPSKPVKRSCPLQGTGMVSGATGAKVLKKSTGPINTTSTDAQLVLAHKNQGNTLLGKLGAQLRALERRPVLQTPKPSTVTSASTNSAPELKPTSFLREHSMSANNCCCSSGCISRCEILYKLPCEHLLCRSCLLDQESPTDSRCPMCYQSFLKGSVHRFHTVKGITYRVLDNSKENTVMAALPGKCSFYVWFLGAKESKGLRGEEFITPVFKYLCQKEYETEPGKVTLQVSEKGLKVIQNIAVTRNASGISTGLSEVVKHFIPHHAITYVAQQEDLIACIVLMYNPLTKCPLHVHVYRCDSEETADFLRHQLQTLVSLPENQRKVTELEDRLKSQGLIPSGNAKLLKSSDTGFGGSMDFDEAGDLERSAMSSKESHSNVTDGDTKYRKSVKSAGQSPDHERIATLYDSLAAELRSKLKVKPTANSTTPILLPPKDYETDTTRLTSASQQNRLSGASYKSGHEPDMDFDKRRRSTLPSSAELSRAAYRAQTPEPIVTSFTEKNSQRWRETVAVQRDRSPERNPQLSRSSSHPQTRLNRDNSYHRSKSREDLGDSSEPSSGIGSDHPPSPLFERSPAPPPPQAEKRPITRGEKNAARERFQGARAVFRSLEKGVQGQPSTNNRLTTKSQARYPPPEEKRHHKFAIDEHYSGHSHSRTRFYEDEPRQSYSLSHARRFGSKPNLYKGYDYENEEEHDPRDYDLRRDRDREHVAKKEHSGRGLQRSSSKLHVYDDERNNKPSRSMSYQEPKIHDPHKRYSYYEPDLRERSSRRDAEVWTASPRNADVYLREPVIAHIPLVSNKDRFVGRSMMDLRSGTDAEHHTIRKLDRHASQEGFLDLSTSSRNDRMPKAQYIDHGHSRKDRYERDHYHEDRLSRYNHTPGEISSKRKPENRQIKHSFESKNRIPGLDRETARLDHHLTSSSGKLTGYVRSAEERERGHYFSSNELQR